MLKLNFDLKNDTKTCYRFEARDGNEFITLYLKKTQIDNAGIEPQQGLTVTIEERN